ncbi:MAG: metal ABC transporter substrate-binding protein [Clostridiales Family XIII bacterium]|jgi:zinc transport system substrate-binding protein|nr:metal ABC transporter substrate-binding protein [Clostridiales Family XIII bacterium]
MKERKYIIAIILLAGLLLASCGGAGPADGASDAEPPGSAGGSGRLNVVTTIFPEYDFARAVAAGTDAEVTLLIPPGTSVHSFDPSPQDVKTVQDADVFVYVGGESDVWADQILAGIDTGGMQIVRLIDHVQTYEEELKEGMQEEEEEADADANAAEEGAEADEHVWTSPKNALVLLGVIADAMGAADPGNADAYGENAAAYAQELEAVDAEIEGVVASAGRKMIVVADKFPLRYFTEDYGLDYAAAFPGCSDQSDAGARTIAYLIEAVGREGLPYIYKVELTNGNVAEAIAEETGAEVLELNSCENLTKDDFDSGVTYVDLMRRNAAALEKGLN